MTVRAKFKVMKKERHNSEGLQSVHLAPVYDPNPKSENGQFWKWTPSGNIVLSTINQKAADYFEEGKEYYVDFLEAPPTPA